MKIEEIRDICTGCTACANICPKKCIEIKFDDEGFYYPFIDHSQCIECKKCESVCHCIEKRPCESQKYSYYGFVNDDAIRSKSSSGGAFYALAQSVIKQGGNVYGAAFDYDDKLLKHMSSDDVGTEPLLKSKYTESFLGDIFSSVQKDIDSKRRVLFCGTPCQAAGLRHYVKDPDNLLIICDFVCHGIPSSKLLCEHLQSIGYYDGLTEIDFRPKEYGWTNKYFTLKKGKKKRTVPYNCDFFYQGFMTSNVFLRKSCYNCQYRNTHYSDLTVADFWGWRNCEGVKNDERGLSLIVAHNQHGNAAVHSIENFNLYPIDNKYSEYAFANKDFSSALLLREKFYRLRKEEGFKKAAQKTFMCGWRKRYIKMLIKKLLKKY